MRKLQYIINVLGYADALDKRVDENVYEFTKLDPFFITDVEWDEMQRRFDAKFMGGQDEQTRTG